MATWTNKGGIAGQVGGGLSPFTENLSNSAFTCDLVVAGFVCWDNVSPTSITDDAGLTYIPLTKYHINDVFVQMFYAHGAALSIPANNNITFTATGTTNRIEFFADFWTGSYIPAPLQTETGHAENTSDSSIVLGPITPDAHESLTYWEGATAIASTGTNSGGHVWPYVHKPDATIADGSNPSFFRGGYNYGDRYIQPFGSYPSAMTWTFDGWTSSVSSAFAIAVFRSKDFVPPALAKSYAEIW